MVSSNDGEGEKLGDTLVEGLTELDGEREEDGDKLLLGETAAATVSCLI